MTIETERDWDNEDDERIHETPIDVTAGYATLEAMTGCTHDEDPCFNACELTAHLQTKRMTVLTVSVAINGQPIFTRSVVNRLRDIGYYVSDDGNLIEHDPKEGAIELAVKALRGVYENPNEVLRRHQHKPMH